MDILTSLFFYLSLLVIIKTFSGRFPYFLPLPSSFFFLEIRDGLIDSEYGIRMTFSLSIKFSIPIQAPLSIPILFFMIFPLDHYNSVPIYSLNTNFPFTLPLFLISYSYDGRDSHFLPHPFLSLRRRISQLRILIIIIS